VPCLSCWRAYYSLEDKKRIGFFQQILETGTPPPVGAIVRIKKWKNFHLHASTAIGNITADQQLSIQTNQGVIDADLIILGTGYAGSVAHIPELSAFVDQILTWGDQYKELSPRLSHFPYLGAHFEFLEKHVATAPYLKNIYCFNYGAYLSHGMVAGDIDLLSIGSERLAEGLTIALFLESYQ
jgi:cation diffusion facilitator CzcD-associated flavoprotein CzcO